jgi:hypothetical protein
MEHKRAYTQRKWGRAKDLRWIDSAKLIGVFNYSGLFFSSPLSLPLSISLSLFPSHGVVLSPTPSLPAVANQPPYDKIADLDRQK